MNLYLKRCPLYYGFKKHNEKDGGRFSPIFAQLESNGIQINYQIIHIFIGKSIIEPGMM